VEVVLSGGDIGLDVTARGPVLQSTWARQQHRRRQLMQLGLEQPPFERAAVQVTVTASSATGAVTVKKMED
jgi:hypothetical protein